MPDSTFSVRLPEDLKREIDAYATETRRSRSFIVKEAIAAYLDERGAYIKALNAAVDSIETEPTYDFDTVKKWTKTWGTEDETALADTDLSGASD